MADKVIQEDTIEKDQVTVEKSTQKDETEVLQESKKDNLQSSDSEDAEEMDPEKAKLMNKLDEFYQEYYLSEFQKFAVGKFIKDKISDPKEEKVDRLREWLIYKLNKKRPPGHKDQMGCPEIIPKLMAKPFYGKEDFPWIAEIEANYEKIKEEVIALRGEKGFQPYRGPSWISDIKAKDGVGRKSTDSGEWNVYYLKLHNLKFTENCEKLPFLMSILDKHLPRQYNHMFLSAMNPETHILKHYGPTNKKLRFHLPLFGIDGSRLRVHDQVKHLKAGEAYVFDDSFEHEAWHDGNDTRVILIADLWHPDLSNDEIKLLDMLQNARMKFEKKISEKDPDRDNFYTVIEDTKDLLKDNEWWKVNEDEFKKVNQISNEN